jgi:hypothetical protein
VTVVDIAADYAGHGELEDGLSRINGREPETLLRA